MFIQNKYFIHEGNLCYGDSDRINQSTIILKLKEEENFELKARIALALNLVVQYSTDILKDRKFKISEISNNTDEEYFYILYSCVYDEQNSSNDFDINYFLKSKNYVNFKELNHEFINLKKELIISKQELEIIISEHEKINDKYSKIVRGEIDMNSSEFRKFMEDRHNINRKYENLLASFHFSTKSFIDWLIYEKAIEKIERYEIQQIF